MITINESRRTSDNKLMAKFIDGDNAIITVMYFDAPANGWMLSPIHKTMAHLEFVQLPALPYLCQSTIDGMDADADTLEFGRYA